VVVEIGLRAVIFLCGLALIVKVLASAVRTFVLPRGVPDWLTREVFLLVRRAFDLRTRKASSYEERDTIMALYSPVALLTLPVAWLLGVWAGGAAIFWALGVGHVSRDMIVSGSSLLTLGFAPVDTLPETFVAFGEAAIGLLLVALLISYLPTMYGAWSRREAAVSALEVRAGSPPAAWEMIIRFHRLGQLSRLGDLWEPWEEWFLDVEESHTSLGPLTFFRSPQPDRSWVTAAGAVMDAAAFYSSTLDLPRDSQAELCIRAGYIALRRIAAFFRFQFDPDPRPDDPISVTREEWDAVVDSLAAEGVPLKADRDQAWRDWSGWRVNYDTVLLQLAALTMAPYAPWSSDRSLQISTRRPPLPAPLREGALSAGPGRAGRG
jgi:hypothetical protein